tara:strand:+ start:325 stop:573 length:249 start_codon:yes stop_codon:yes gene_type:complete
MSVNKLNEDQRECNVCGKTFDYENCMPLISFLVTYLHLMRDLKISLEDQILKLNEWQEKYQDIMFGVWLCMDCAHKHNTDRK